ncbi:galactosylgalactosylxylosylprotein 3-beta-glucuronosyltransferase 3-like [Hyalella azteca]|uniref:Galactosylgalactosylxylosylprotein 3-beta-glucuronosyltransferase n=1 Tax=Hyalella azteca TaxID=294128 RepID=A0A979FXV1_HYAAZ|nr:galactosylgalactosylxylosylprotein 3-beta-glucuronosyltransferase 3-like [Hyalella azteca]
MRRRGWCSASCFLLIVSGMAFTRFTRRVSHAPDTYTPNELGVCTGRRWPADVPPLYVITPTYRRAEQIPELTRLAQTLLLVDSLVWIVVDDADEPTPAVVNYLQERRICHVYLIETSAEEAPWDRFHGEARRGERITLCRKSFNFTRAKLSAAIKETNFMRLFEVS